MPIFKHDIQLDCDEMPNQRLIEGREKNILLILGSGACIFDDIEAAERLLGPLPYDVMACNLSFLAYNKHILHLVSVHPERLLYFYELAKLLPEQRMAHIYTHSFMLCEGIQHAWPIANQEGTSSMFCIKVGLLLGYKKIIVAGVPLEGSRRFYDNPNQEFINNFSCSAIERAWRDWAKTEAFVNNVRSMSGKSAVILGTPTKGWLENGL